MRSYLLIALFSLFLIGQAAAQDSPEAAPEPAKDPLTTINPDVPLDQLQVMVKPLTKSELQIEANAWFELLRQKSRQIAAVRLGVKKTNEAIDAGDEQATEETLNSAAAVKESVDAIAEETEQQITQSARDSLGVESPVAEDEPEADQPAEQSPASESDSADGDSGQDDVTEEAEIVKDELLEDVTVLQDERTGLSDRLKVVLDSLERKGGDVDEYHSYVVAVSGVELDTSDASTAWKGVIGWITSKEGGQRWGWNLGKFSLILLVTYLIAKVIASVVNWLLERKVKLTQLAERLISRTIKNLIMLIGFAVALTALEIDISPILAAIGATGLVVGLALQGTLSNFASGLMILINRPFDVGNLVSAGGVTGKVHQMNLVSTTFRTFDNQTIYVPNNEIWNNVITNITANETRRVDLEFGIGYDDDFEQAEQIIQDAVVSHALVLEDPEPVVVTHALADSSVNIVCRPWVKTDNWWKVKTDITREVKRRFDQAGISIPYPQQDIHVYNNHSPFENSSSSREREPREA